MITIVDYGMGNLASVNNAIKRYTDQVVVSSMPDDIKKTDKLILPGVGAFKDAYDEIGKRGLINSILDFIKSGKPFLGICLGLQLLFTKSFEGGEYKGLDIIKGDVVSLQKDKGIKIPHMGWNNLKPEKPNCPLLKGVSEQAYMYFVHSYYVVPEDASVVATTTDYGSRFCSMIWKDNIYAMQFHPEKSQEEGLKIIKNFVSL
ncbi:MAG: imidazole glycerol phosphate synthase subunit HisH [Candidatus Orphnella occulta]|nr:imidazole glycerol phosphate synthase subunit HisH [Candidatus Orphnella occulta]MDP8297792.1 imidazole glycerol phosphate synthase subunit HisH [Candidatus Orphnella occulta]